MFIRGHTYIKNVNRLLFCFFVPYFCIVVISYANIGANSCIVVEFFERMRCLYINDNFFFFENKKCLKDFCGAFFTFENEHYNPGKT